MINLKHARRYAFRVGAQVAELQKGGHDDAATKVQAAYSAFLAQFDEDHEVTRDWLHNEYELGLDGELPLYKPKYKIHSVNGAWTYVKA